jgi:catechol 2,3-dioxygenase-like lactoylglutathione lyase family enzyme
MPSSANLKQAVPFFGIEDMERSLRFYVEGLGFAVRNSWSPEGKLRWCWLTLDGVSLMLQEYLPGRRPDGTLGLGLSICVMCDDAVAYYRELRAKGIDACEPFVGNGLWVTSVRDPDGYKLEFESPADLPEETKLSELEGE